MTWNVRVFSGRNVPAGAPCPICTELSHCMDVAWKVARRGGELCSDHPPASECVCAYHFCLDNVRWDGTLLSAATSGLIPPHPRRIAAPIKALRRTMLIGSA